MTKIKVYLNYNNNASSLLSIPIMRYYRYFKSQGVLFRLGFSKNILNDDSSQVWISSRWLGYHLAKNPEWDYLEWMCDLKLKGKIIKFFDLSDSAGNLIRDILPIVDIYYKTYIYSDLNIYEKHLMGGRYFTDILYGGSQRNINASFSEHVGYNSIDPKYLVKLKLFWNHAYLYRNNWATRLFAYGKITERFTKYINKYSKSILFTGRFNTNYRNQIIHDHRLKFTQILNAKGIPTQKVPLEEFIIEMLQANVCFSPYGWGEFAYRDYEAWLARCALIKPDMSKIVTYPELYSPYKNFIPINIDLSNLDDIIEQIKSHKINYEEIANYGHNNFLKIISESEDDDKLLSRLQEIIHVSFA